MPQMTGHITIEQGEESFELKVDFETRVYARGRGCEETEVHVGDYIFTLDGEEISEKELWRKFGTTAEHYTKQCIDSAEEI